MHRVCTGNLFTCAFRNGWINLTSTFSLESQKQLAM